MPKKPKAPETFDEHVGDVVQTHMRRKGLSQADIAEATGIPLSLIGRSIRGTRPLSVQEFERIAGAVTRASEDANVKAAVMVQEALDNFGGMAKLLAQQAVSDDTFTVEPDENVTQVDFTPRLENVADERSRRGADIDDGVDEDGPEEGA